MRVERLTPLVIGVLLWGTLVTVGRAASPAVDADPYLWLEDIHGQKAMAWVQDQNAKSLAVLKADPGYQKSYDAVLAILDAPDRVPYSRLDHAYAFNFWQDARNPKGVWRRTTISDFKTASPAWDVLLDLDALAAAEHENWVWHGAVCSPSLARCLVSLSRGGGDAVVVREFDPAAKAFVTQDGFALVEAKSDAAYAGDDTILFGTDFGPNSLTTSGYPRLMKMWKRGQPVGQAKMLLEGKASDVGLQTAVFSGPRGTIPLIAREMTFFESEYHYVLSDGTTLKLPLPASADLKGALQDQLILTLRDAWTQPSGRVLPKGALIAFPVGDYVRTRKAADAALLYAPDARSTIDQVDTGAAAVYAAIYSNVIGSVHAFRLSAHGWSDENLDLPAAGSTGIAAVNAWGPEAEFRFENFVTPPTLYHFDGTGKPEAIKSLPARYDASGLVTQQFEAVSNDGTKVPYFVTRRADAKGPQPAVLYGYGGFEISETPSYVVSAGKLWLEKGGAYIVANIRGGGEFGPGWHEAALKTHRQRAYDDFAAVAADAERRGVTSAKQLGIMGGSNGGLLVSTVMTQHPELFGAVVCQVPLADMIRYTLIGAGASWEAEYGDPADPKMRDYLLTYSPYQNVRPGKNYPPVLFVTATSDDRVTPVHARKMAAKMEALGYKVLFFENTDGGHAAAADHKQAAEMSALSFVYLRRMLTH